MEWKSGYSVGVGEIDIEHKKMIAYINELEAVIENSNAQKQVVFVLNGLVSYTREHFAKEESYFKQFDYEHTDEHIAEHSELISDVEKLIYQFEVGDKLSPVGIIKFLSNWFVDHILGSDKKYIDCFSRHGLS